MYLIRRVIKVKPGMARKAAEVLHKIGKAYEEVGQRSPVRVYISGGTVPGPANTVYMDWTAERLESPYRSSNKLPDAVRQVGSALRELQEESSIEFYEMYPPE